jgi:PAS domain S-box-containing protein
LTTPAVRAGRSATATPVPAPETPVRSSLGDLADAVPHLVWVAGEDGAIRAYNGRISAYGSARTGEDESWRWELLVHPDDLESTAASWAAAIATGRTYEHEHRLRMADGSYRWHLSRGVRVTEPSTGEVCWYGTATDIDTVQIAENLLRRTQSSLALAMRGGRMGWWTRDLETEVVTWSPELEELFGLPPGGFEGRESAFLERVHEDDRSAVSTAVADAIAHRTDYAVTFRFRHADGSLRWMDGRGRATYAGDRAVVLYGIGMDVTERMEAEAAVRTSEERLRIAAEVADFGLYDLDFVNNDLYWSRELRAMLLWDADEPPVAGVIPIHPEDREATQALVAESRDPLGDGSFDHEYRIVRTDGSIRWLAVHGQTFFDRPEPDPERHAVRAVGVVSDVTERRQAAEIRDVFIGMLSHELRTPVTAIYGGSLLLRRPHLAENDRRDIVDDIVSESERLERLIENLLVLARAERKSVEGGKDPVLIRPLMERIVADKRRRWPKATIVLEAAAGLAPARWDESSFELVLRNLISNALKYGGDDGRILVRAVMDDDKIAISVADDGPGLPEDETDRLFELFYRTDDARRQAQGAGIGLFVVRALVESAGGHTWARNRPTGGAEFGFRLPRFVESDDGFDAD